MTISTAIASSSIARGVGIETKFQNLRGGAQFLPSRIGVVGQGNINVDYPLTKRRITSAIEAAKLYGFGSPIHLSVLQLFPANGKGVGNIPVTIYPLSLISHKLDVSFKYDWTPIKTENHKAWQFKNIAEYKSFTTYFKPDFIRYENNVYKSLTDDNRNNPVDIDNEPYAEYDEYNDINTIYRPGTKITYEERDYECIKLNGGNVSVVNVTGEEVQLIAIPGSYGGWSLYPHSYHYSIHEAYKKTVGVPLKDLVVEWEGLFYQPILDNGSNTNAGIRIPDYSKFERTPPYEVGKQYSKGDLVSSRDITYEALFKINKGVSPKKWFDVFWKEIDVANYEEDMICLVNDVVNINGISYRYTGVPAWEIIEIALYDNDKKYSNAGTKLLVSFNNEIYSYQNTEDQTGIRPVDLYWKVIDRIHPSWSLVASYSKEETYSIGDKVADEGIKLYEAILDNGPDTEIGVQNLNYQQFSDTIPIFDKKINYKKGTIVKLDDDRLFKKNIDIVDRPKVPGTPSTGKIVPIIFASNLSTNDQGEYKVIINNIESQSIIIKTTDVIDDITQKITIAINSILEMPVLALDKNNSIELKSKWEGDSANDILLKIIGSSISSLKFEITQFANGAINPNVDNALRQMGDVWETMLLNCLNISDTDALDEFSRFGEDRWSSEIKKPLIVFTGNTKTRMRDAIEICKKRNSDRINSQLVAPGSSELPFVVAARQLARIAHIANNNPPQDYGGQSVVGLEPGIDGEQWKYRERDLAVKAGSSTILVKDGVINIADVVTFYHLNGGEFSAYRYIADIVKLQNIIFNLDCIFDSSEWNGAPLIPDDQATVNRSAKQPKSAVAAIATLLDRLALEGIISDPKTAKSNTIALINEQNPKRLDISITVQLSGNANIISTDLNFGFFFGQSI